MTKPANWGMTNQTRRVGGDDGGQVEGSGQHDDPHERQTHEDLVAKHLGYPAQRAEERVLAAGGPPGQGHAVGPQRREGEEVQEAHVQVDHHDTRREGDHREGEQHGDNDDGRGDDEYGSVREGGNPVLLGENLDHVREDLEEAERPTC
jgi:hypothetical protein